jgi:hypothetical protein
MNGIERSHVWEMVSARGCPDGVVDFHPAQLGKNRRNPRESSRFFASERSWHLELGEFGRDDGLA